jgi:DNA gyrase subunit B
VADEKDVTKLRYHTVVIMTDADVDGSHIRTLLLTLFFRQFIEIIEGGYLYIAQPPLFRAKKGKQERYLKDEIALEEYLTDLGAEALTFQAGKGNSIRELHGAPLKTMVRKALARERMYDGLARRSKERPIIETLAHLIADKRAGDESFRSQKALKELAETIVKELKGNLVCRIEPERLETERIESEGTEPEDNGTFRAIFTHVQNGATAPTVVDSALLRAGELREIRRLDADLEALKAPYKLKAGDGERTVESLKAVADAVLEAGHKGVEIQRYKGLGEMNPEQLWATTMNPETRTMLRVQIGAQEDAEEIFQKLMGDQVEPRRQFIEENALNVRNLDI